MDIKKIKKNKGCVLCFMHSLKRTGFTGQFETVSLQLIGTKSIIQILDKKVVLSIFFQQSTKNYDIWCCNNLDLCQARILIQYQAIRMGSYAMELPLLFFYYPPFSGISSCVRIVDMVMCLHTWHSPASNSRPGS